MAGAVQIKSSPGNGTLSSGFHNSFDQNLLSVFFGFLKVWIHGLASAVPRIREFQGRRTMTTTASTPTARAAALLTSEWDTVRAALLCYASDQREVGHHAWADQIMEVYGILRNQTR